MRSERIKGFISGVTLSMLILGLGTTAYAAYQKTATLDYTGIKITLNGSAITPSDAAGNSVEPFAIDGTTYLPVRAIAGALGLEAGWDQGTQTVVLKTATTSTSSGGASGQSANSTVAYTRKNPAPLGTIQSINVNNYIETYNASAVVLESLRGDAAWAKIKNANMFNSQAPEGTEYVLVKLRVSLNSIDSDKSISFSNYNFTPYSGDNAEYSSTFVVTPTPQFSGSLYAGGTLEGYAVYLVNKSDTAPKLVFGEDYDGSGGIWFSMT